MLLHEKADQADALLHETGLDCWLTFARETGEHPDPGVELVVGAGVVRSSAFLFHKGGQRIALVARFDAATIRDLGVFGEVIAYDEDFKGPLLEVLARLDPQVIGLNYSADDVTADGLTYGHWLRLTAALRDTPYLNRLTSAAPLLSRLRGRKTATEVERIRKAVAETEAIVALLDNKVRPGVSALELAAFVHGEFRRRGLACAWEEAGCPIVDVGPTESGHTRPSAEARIEPGQVVHVDLGVKWEGYCSDLQRLWYVRQPGEAGMPEEARRACATVVRAIEAAAAALRPGVVGHEVDAAARRVVVEAGYPEFKHGVGHGLGRAVHDGGTLLGPRWPCYGETVDGVVEEGNVFTLELGIATEVGCIGLEEDVLVTRGGCEFLSSFPRAPVLV